MKKVAIDTLGCKVNQYDSALLEECFKQEKFEIVGSHQPADIYIVNSCTVTAKADQEAKHLLRRYQRKNPNATLVLTGCFAQTGFKKLTEEKNIHYVVGNTLKSKLVELLKNQTVQPLKPEIHVENAFKNGNVTNIPIHAPQETTRVFLKIQDGCDDFCTFCIIPYARGKSRSLSDEFVLRQIQLLVEEGVKEVVLTGVSLGSYGTDLSPKTNLAQLVHKIEKNTSLLRLRISSLEPEDVSDELLSTLQESEKFCPHFHLPIQSGDDFVLSKMQRNYTSAYYENLITKINKKFKDVFIGSDVICGFPGESEQHFQNTFTFLENLPWSKLHVFPYSPRLGTPAAKFPEQLERSEILKRSGQLRALSEKRHSDFLEKFIGLSQLCLVEKKEKRGFYQALSRNYLNMYFQTSEPAINQEILLKPISRKGEELFADLL